ncbi:hypothetical protein MC885_003292 [Smutsia gigantea]|nr:hypothetical protein MC885_003292 [Smutsia gigantea]
MVRLRPLHHLYGARLRGRDRAARLRVAPGGREGGPRRRRRQRRRRRRRRNQSETVTEPWLELASGAGRQQPRKGRRLRQGSRESRNSKKERGEKGPGAAGRAGGTALAQRHGSFLEINIKKKAEDAEGKVGVTGKARHTERETEPLSERKEEGNSRRQPM